MTRSDESFDLESTTTAEAETMGPDSDTESPESEQTSTDTHEVSDQLEIISAREGDESMSLDDDANDQDTVTTPTNRPAHR